MLPGAMVSVTTLDQRESCLEVGYRLRKGLELSSPCLLKARPRTSPDLDWEFVRTLNHPGRVAFELVQTMSLRITAAWELLAFGQTSPSHWLATGCRTMSPGQVAEQPPSQASPMAVQSHPCWEPAQFKLQIRSRYPC